MSTGTLKSPASIGDVIVIGGHHVGEGRRMGEILEVIGERDHEHYRVRWEDGRETVFFASTTRQFTRGRGGVGGRAHSRRSASRYGFTVETSEQTRVVGIVEHSLRHRASLGQP